MVNRFAVTLVFMLIAMNGCRIAGPSGADPESAALPAGAVPADVTASLTQSAAGMVSRDDAIAAARKQYPALLSDGKVDAYLVTATDPSTRGNVAIKDRTLWILHLSGIAYPISIPYGRSAGSDSVGSGWIYIDAYTGRWLLSRFED